jgi:hypothetical protein
MDIETVELNQILKEADLKPRGYSGRGMNGMECVAVSADTLLDGLAAIVEASGDVETAAHLVREASFETLGRKTIIFWSELEWEPEEKELGEAGEEED